MTEPVSQTQASVSAYEVLRQSRTDSLNLAKRQQDVEIAKQAAETALAALNAYQTSGRVLTEAEQTLAWALRTLRVETS